ncbi:F0F1 ATP synthase subunit gamma [Mucilaginibacter sp. X4EP1]|uniref:F0F1 ATP synthase subunit gamma n=1 Tax=Mucilaginibacter sp. X4EP1 TaxID=2723092 RepID=UPI0021671668|nr:F0F1 ATP synthase subunit gamma [Mucilaginibacter sp. X4EP1]MCS3812142.1 F-type H+-transporting ATPase subunit gamma [Mucilaginibacter sp. X4EP1]
MDTLEDLRKKLSGAKDIKSVVRAMKAMAASNITQYEAAVSSLGDYYHTVSLGIVAWLIHEKINGVTDNKVPGRSNGKSVCAIVFGSDQGLVGRFNNVMADFVKRSLDALPGNKTLWVIGERVQLLLADAGLMAAKTFAVPNAIDAVTPLIGQILAAIGDLTERQPETQFYIFHNQPKPLAGYEPAVQRLLPLDERWRHDFDQVKWPTSKLPELIGDPGPALLALINEYLFVSLFKACAESLASENASRLEAMQRADKNIGNLLDSLGHKFQRLRQSSIDEELFDVVSGFEALNAGE